MAFSKYVDVMKQWSEPAVDWAADHPRLALGLAVSTLGTLYWVQRRLRAPHLPPGPTRWPIIGAIPSLTDKFHEDVMRLKEKYGDIFTVWMGSTPLVVLASYDSLKEAFLSRGSDFASRPYAAVFSPDDFKDEIFNAPFNEDWSKNKKYALTSLRTLGGVKAAADGAIIEEITVLIDKLRSTGQEAVDVKDILLMTTANIMSGMMFNERLDHADPKLTEFKDLVVKFNQSFSEFSILEFMLPVWFVNVASRGKQQRFRRSLKNLQDYVIRHVEEHRKTLDPDNPRDFIDMYLIKPGMDIGVGFYDTLIVFLPDAIDSIAVFMRWIVLYLAHHPDVQKKAQAEIDQVVGHNQMVNISHRSQLKYTDAVILEVMRCSDSSNGSAFHCASKSGLTFRGYDMRPSVCLVGSFYAVHKDPKLFPDPEKFDPQRFISESGDLVNANLVLPFSLGRRMCLGESLTKLELFIFTANVLRAFNIRLPPGTEKPSLKPAGGIILYPEPFKVIFEPRG